MLRQVQINYALWHDDEFMDDGVLFTTHVQLKIYCPDTWDAVHAGRTSPDLQNNSGRPGLRLSITRHIKLWILNFIFFENSLSF